MAQKKKSTGGLTGGRGSTAGDVYHELWALRAALALTIPKTELKAVTVEGIPTGLSGKDLYAAVDCGLFYGAPTLETASRVELVQLKFSTASPNQAWTVARLTSSTGKSKNNSVLRGLAETFSEADKKKATGAQLTIKMESNQPIAPEVLTAVSKLQAGNKTDAKVKKLATAIGLQGKALQKFLTALSFMGMGGPGREGVQNAIAQTVALMVETDIEKTINEQRTKIRDLMLPGREEYITRDTVLLWFGIASEKGIFPSPTEFQSLGSVILRNPAKEVIKKVEEGSRLICVDGPGGCGKTTTMRQLEAMLPPGSLTVIYDCYGAGRYLYSDYKRHLPENAFLQIVNELAVAQGLPQLMAFASSKKADIVSFRERVSASAELLKKASPSGILAVLVDAADNAVAAAEKWKEPCFALDIAGADLNSLPSNVAIIFSTRTVRKTKLALPAHTAVACPAFDDTETRAFVDLNIAPPVDDPWVEQFHQFTDGIARVQAVAMKAGAKDPAKVMQSLMPVGKGLKDVLEELLKEAAKKSGDDIFYNDCVAALSVLPPPIPVKHLATICNVAEGAIRDFVADVAPSIRIEKDAVSISDEDVEDFLREAGAGHRAKMVAAACAVFQPIMDTDSYASAHYCDLLVEAGRAKEILGIVEGELEPKGISDPIIKREVQLHRLRLAMNACASAGSPTDTLKVALLGAEAAKDEAALRGLLEQNPRLSVRFAEVSLHRLVLNDRDRFKQQGAVLAHQAAKAAQDGEMNSARERIHLYDHWVSEILTLPEEKREKIKFTWDDAAAIAQARILTEGAKSFVDRFSKFRLLKQLQAGRVLLTQLLTDGNVDVLKEVYQEGYLSPLHNLMVTEALAMAGEAISTKRLAIELAAVRLRNVPDVRRMRDDWQTELCERYTVACEIGFSRGVAKNTLLKLLGLLLDHRRTPSPKIARYEAARIDIALRAWLLRNHLSGVAATPVMFVAFCEDTNVPKKPEPAEDKRSPLNAEQQREANREREEHEQLTRIVAALFPVYKARLDILIEAKTGKVAGKPKTSIPTVNDDYAFSREHQANNFRVALGRGIAQLMHIKGIEVGFLLERALDNAKSKFDGLTASRSLPVWREFLARHAGQSDILKSVTDRARELKTVRVGAKDKSSALLDFSELVVGFSPHDAQAFFEQAVEIAKDIDRDSMVQIDFISHLAKRVGAATSAERLALATSFAAFVTDMAIRLEGEEYFPWENAVGGLFELTPEVALAALSQWHDEGLERLSSTLPVFIRKLAVDPTWVPCACALAFALGYVDHETLNDLAAKAAALGGKRAQDTLELLSKKVVFDVKPDRRVSLGQAFGAYPAFKSIKQPASQYLRELVKMTAPPVPAPNTKSKAVVVPFPAGAQLKTAADFEQALAFAQNALKGKYVPVSTILAALRDQITSPGQHVPYLDAIGIIGNDFHADDHAEAIIGALAAWAGQPAVENWRKNVLPPILSKNFRALTRWLSDRQSRLPALLEATTLDDQQRVTLLGEALQLCAQDLGSGALYALCDLMAKHLAPNDAKVLITWYVERAGRHLLADITDRFKPSEMPKGLTEAFGRFSFAMLSDIDLRFRWRTAHFVRHLNAVDGGATLTSLLAQYDRKVDGAFRLRTAPFYWLGARLWTVMIASRIALENPSGMKGHLQKLFSIATDANLPHYLIKRHAKRAIEHLQSARAISLSAARKKTLAAVNQSVRKPVKEKRSFKDLERSGGPGRRFNFNSLDTIPYWYSPLYRNFAKITPDQFFKAVEKWIVDKWGADKTANHWDKEFRKGRMRESESMRAYHGHGSQPSLERYGTYLEWHGMFCAIGDLLKTHPLAKPEDESDTLEHWVERWDLTEIDTWLYDRRSPPPLTSEFQINVLGDDAGWFAKDVGGQFLEFALGNKQAAQKSLTIYGDWSTAAPTREVHVEIHSALASRSTAAALVRALSEGKERFWLPTETEHHDFDNETNEDPFKIVPTVHRQGRDTEIDKDDPLRKEVSEIQASPSTALRKAYKWIAGGRPVSEWTVAGGRVVVKYEAWSDSDDRETGDSRRSQRRLGVDGYRLTLDKAELFRILKSHGMDLIVEVMIERRLENEYGERSSWDDKTKRKEARKAFIFRESGEIEDANGPVGRWR